MEITMTDMEWDEDHRPPDKLDILLHTMSVLLWFNHPDRPDEAPNMCETLRMLGLVDRHLLRDEGVFSYTARPNLLRLAYGSDKFFRSLREFKKRGLITKEDLRALRSSFKRTDGLTEG
jgi:hypothetical protein